jgi:hypothetical protein
LVGEAAWKNLSTADIKKMINNEWEHGIKLDFDGSTKPFVVDLPKGAKRSEITLHG